MCRRVGLWRRRKESKEMKLSDLKGKTVGVCVSGGLDSKTICCVLKDAGVKVKAFSANVGQPDEKDINDIKKKMAPTGVETTIVDVTEEMADICFETVKCQAIRQRRLPDLPQRHGHGNEL